MEDCKLIHNDSICFAFTGPAVEGGKMDALLFAKSLEAFRNLALEANKALYESSVEISVEITANFEDSSFEWVVNTKEKALSITKSLWDDKALPSAKKLWEDGETLHKTASICTILGFTVLVGTNLIDFLRDAEGEKIELIETHSGANTVKIKCGKAEIDIPVEIYKLQEDLATRRNLEQFIKPICEKGIDGLEVRKNKKTTKRIETKDYYSLRAPDIKQEVEKYEYSSIFTIASPHMLHGNKWRLIDNENNVERTFEITDKDFIDDVYRKRYAFTSGDKLRALVEVTIFETKRGRELRYKLLHMQEYISSNSFDL